MRESSSRRRISGRAHSFQPGNIFLDQGLKLSDFIHGTFGKDCEVAGILGKEISAKRLDRAAEIFDLLKGLLQLRFVLNHNFSLNMPLVRPGSNRKKAGLLSCSQPFVRSALSC